MSRALLPILRTSWPALVTRVRLLRRRPLLLNVRSLLQRIPFKPLDVNCLYLLEYVGIPPEHPGSLRGRAEVRRGTLEDLYEPYLLQAGFLQRTPRGRIASAQAYRHLGILPPRKEGSLF